MDKPVFQNILVGVDGSEDSYMAAEYAVKLAQATNGSVTFLFVITESYIKKQYQTDGAPSMIGEAMVEQARTEEKSREVFARVSEIATQCIGKKYCSTKTRKGLPQEEFVKELNEGTYDLCVLGRQGASQSFVTVFGRVSDAIFKKTNVPLLIIKHQPGN